MAEHLEVPVADVWAWMGALARWLSDQGYCRQISDEKVSEVERTLDAIDHPRVDAAEKSAAVRDALTWLWSYVLPAASTSANPYLERLPSGRAEGAPTPEYELVNEARALFGKIRGLRKFVDPVVAIRNERALPLGGEPGMHIESGYDDALDAWEAFMAAIDPLWMDSGILALRIPYSMQEWKESCSQLEVALKAAGFQDAELDALVPGAGGPKAVAQRRYRHQKRTAEKAEADRWKAVRRELVVLSAIKRERVLSFFRPPARLASLRPSERVAAVKEFQGLGLLACAAMVQARAVGAVDRTGDDT
jgi:hypothetical protein